MAFSKTPLTPKEKKKLEEDLLEMVDKESSLEQPRDKVKEERSVRVQHKLSKEKIKTFLLRVPESVFNDLEEIKLRTGVSINAICSEMIRPQIKQKLRELNEMEYNV